MARFTTTLRLPTRARKTLQVYYGHQRLQPGDYGDTEYMLSVSSPAFAHSAS